jgi:hypothetical protein
MALPTGFNWRKCHTCMHYADEIFSKEYGSVKGRFCPHKHDMIHELETGIPCENYQKREHPLYLRECAPRVLDADKCFYDQGERKWHWE